MPAAGGALTEKTGKLRIGVVGTGALGRHHVRILSSLEGVELVGAFDQSSERLTAVCSEHGARPFDSLETLAREVEAMVVAVPTEFHGEVGGTLLEQGVDVLIEKPLALSLAEADQIIEAGKNRIVAVGHVEFFNPAVSALREHVTAPRFVEVERLATFTPRSLDVDVILDLMIHDLQIVQALDPSPIVEVRATGIDVLSSRVDIANARLQFASGATANLTASRVSAERVRKLRVFQHRRYYSLDYQEQEIKGYRLEELDSSRRIVPEDLRVDKAEPLRRELAGFAAACRGEGGEFVDAAAARRALATALEIASVASS